VARRLWNLLTLRRLDPRTRRFALILSVPALLLLVGTVGYETIEEKYTFLDALYMTVITLSTIGYGEVHPLSTAGRWFTIFLIFGGVFTLAYTVAEMIRTVVSGEVQQYFGKQRMERSLAELRDHLIVCGYGRMGRLVCQEFAAKGVPFVVIDLDAGRLEDFRAAHGIALPGDATSDAVLKRAGIERARALVAVLSSDADNLYLTLSARLLNDKLCIVSRAEDAASEQKLLRAGATRVVSPYQIGGVRVAHAVLRPAVVDFIELATRTEHFALQIEEVRVAARSRLAGTALRDSRLRQDYHVIIVAVKKASGHMAFNPPPEFVLAEGDVLIAIGAREHLDRLEAVANG
jgi:voltage-gated potassium channel